MSQDLALTRAYEAAETALVNDSDEVLTATTAALSVLYDGAMNARANAERLLAEGLTVEDLGGVIGAARQLLALAAAAQAVAPLHRPKEAPTPS
jgi:hypothetical protein